MTHHSDILDLAQQLADTERDARDLVASLTPEEGTWRPHPGAWSIAECLDHLATADRVYLSAMTEPARRARDAGRTRRGAARPGIIGAAFVRSQEPPVKHRMKAPAKIRPRESPELGDAMSAFLDAHGAVHRFLDENADLDLAGVRFVNPFVSLLRFSLATGLHAIVAHERRHLWQAHRVMAAARAVHVSDSPDGGRQARHPAKGGVAA